MTPSRGMAPFFASKQLVQLGHEGADILELPVHRGKADIGHLVHILEPLHDHLADAAGGDLPIHLVLERLLDLLGDLLQGIKGHRPLLTGPDHPVEELAAVKGLAAAVLLDDHHGQRLHDLEGGKTLVTLQALPAAADAGAVLGRPGVHDLAVDVTAKGTFHAVHTPMYGISSCRAAAVQPPTTDYFITRSEI